MNKNQKLGKNFSLKEFTRSQIARRNNIDNTPDEKQIENLKELVQNLLQPLRDRVKCPITVTSGYRSFRVNFLAGGSIHSQHMEGKAADIDITCMPLENLFRIIAEDFDYDQLIYEFGEWIHVSWNGKKNRKSTLIAFFEHGKIKYRKYNPENDKQQKRETK